MTQVNNQKIIGKKATSQMLIDLLENSDPSKEGAQHLTDLANQYGALFLMRKGNTAVIGYMVSHYPTREEKARFRQDGEELRKQGMRLNGEEGDDLEGTLNAYLGDKGKPSVKSCRVELYEDHRFEIDGAPNEDSTPEAGYAITVLTVSLDDLMQNNLVSGAVDALASLHSGGSFLPISLRACTSETYLERASSPVNLESHYSMLDVLSRDKEHLDPENQLRAEDLEASLRAEIAEKAVTPFTLAELDNMRGTPLFKNSLTAEALEGIKGRYVGNPSIFFREGAS